MSATVDQELAELRRAGAELRRAYAESQRAIQSCRTNEMLHWQSYKHALRHSHNAIANMVSV